MRRWIGLLGSWAMLVLGLGLASFAIAGEWINVRDERRLDRVATIDTMIAQRNAGRAEELRREGQHRAASVSALQTRLQALAKQTDDQQDSSQTIIVSTGANKVYLRQNGQTVFEAICSTGKGTKLVIDGRTMVFDTPIGKFRILSKDENPQWVPPDWHYVEQARKSGKRVIRLAPGDAIDADTGEPVARMNGDGVWGWFSGHAAPRRILKVDHGTVVEENNGTVRELAPGTMITVGDALVIPPATSPQRHFDKVLGRYRLNLGDGYAIHGTQEYAQLGRSVSHGCVRLGDDDIAKLFGIAKVGDEVIIY